MDKPLLSIVIANYNYGRFLEDAIKSVITQGVDDKVELIICDAASTDNSLEIIKKYANGLPPNTTYDSFVNEKFHATTQDTQLISWWCSEKDGGQSAAFNKGFSHARGEWLTWLNADDLLLPGTLRAFESLVARCPKAIWVTGNKVHFDSATGLITRVHWGPHTMPPLLRRNHASSGVYGPTSFFRKDLFVKAGGIDESLHYAMDTEYWARVTMLGVRQLRLRKFCWAFRDHDESKTSGLQSEAVARKRQAESLYWRAKTGYSYIHGFSNPWYVLWVIWRVIDGSFIAKAIMRRKYKGKRLSEVQFYRK